MLNLSAKDLHKRGLVGFNALEQIEQKKSSKVLTRLILSFLSIGLVILFLPWTQHIRSKGKVTTLRPDQRPQEVHAVIAGRINNWYVQEGDFVQKGDTLAYLTEVKAAYFDPELVPRTQEQIGFKRESIEAYADKLEALNEQYKNLKREQGLKQQQIEIKLKQIVLKVERDSLKYQSAILKKVTAKKQLERIKGLQKEGLKSLSVLENYRLKYQEALAYETEAYNKLRMSKNAFVDQELERTNTSVKYDNMLAKNRSEKFSVLSKMKEAEVDESKLRNTLANYKQRASHYYILAPQEGYVSRTNQVGIGETIKEGKPLLSIMPKRYELAVELFVDPVDLPLIQVNQDVRIQFDGWPAVVFSGWPGVSQGTYGGRVYAIEQYLGKNGKYRVLVMPDDAEHPWPSALRFGSGTSNLILLKDVSVWYELWRKINGFPADFYQPAEKIEKKS